MHIHICLSRLRLSLTLHSMDPTREPLSVEPSYKAAHAVLNTHELLHDILVRLPVIDLVVATGVCRTWHRLKDNVEIQQALFLVPMEVGDIMANTGLCLSMRLEDIHRDKYVLYCRRDSRCPRSFQLRAQCMV